jgi:hypothetical protein
MNHRLPVAPTSLRSLSVPTELAFSIQSLPVSISSGSSFIPWRPIAGSAAISGRTGAVVADQSIKNYPITRFITLSFE